MSDTPRQSRLSAEETVVDWSVREIREELAIDITVGEYLMSIEHTYPTFQITPIVYLTSCTNTKLLLLRQDRGTPTQLTCRGAPCGYPGSTLLLVSVL
ncbi:MAG: hypothetical protein LH613_07025 [Chamaesiphon sp.]|nr:hypothetical protein [Chamaesiphon sp.]